MTHGGARCDNTPLDTLAGGGVSCARDWDKLSEDGMQEQQEGPAPCAVPKKRPTRAVLANTITKRPIDWLWKPYIQRRAINLLTGDPGVGKSTLVCEIVSALSHGRPLPGDPPSHTRAPIITWIMNGEDAADDTIVWRLENQGADMSKVYITDKREVITVDSAKQIGQEAADLGVKLLIIDPLQAWMGSGVDMNKANETREWGGFLREAAMKHDFAVLLCRHRRKGLPGDNKLYSGIGSIDITGFARSELSATKDKNGNLYMERTKGTVGITGQALGYTIEPLDDPANDHGRFRWLGAITPNSKSDKPEPNTTPKVLALAITWIQGRLSMGPVSALDMNAEARERGISERTLERAKREAGVVSKQLGPSDWVWVLNG